MNLRCMLKIFVDGLCVDVRNIVYALSKAPEGIMLPLPRWGRWVKWVEERQKENGEQHPPRLPHRFKCNDFSVMHQQIYFIVVSIQRFKGRPRPQQLSLFISCLSLRHPVTPQVVQPGGSGYIPQLRTLRCGRYDLSYV